ncbi:MAG: SDR family oxidoreductase [Gammaproteobacteria bacterium]
MYKWINFIHLICAALMPLTVFAENNNPTVLITGSNRGIGLEFVRQLAERDWRVIATARKPQSAAELQALAKQDSDIIIEQLDVTSAADLNELKTRIKDQPIDILLLNAAKGPTEKTALVPLAKQNLDLASDFFTVNAIGPMRVAQAFMDNVKASDRKTVIAISSDSGSFVAGSQLPILYHYKASKAALNMYFHTLAFEAKKRDVTVIMLHPGMVATNEQTARLPNAMPTSESVGQMMQVIDGLTPTDNGRFMDYQGNTMPW